MIWRKARKKPVVVEFRDVEPKQLIYRCREENIQIGYGEWVGTREGKLYAEPEKDFIIRGVKGEFYPIKKDIFYETYEVIED